MWLIKILLKGVTIFKKLFLFWRGITVVVQLFYSSDYSCISDKTFRSQSTILFTVIFNFISLYFFKMISHSYKIITRVSEISWIISVLQFTEKFLRVKVSFFFQ